MEGGSGSRPGAVVLAAGGSTRMGGRPKALLPVGDEPAVARIVRELAELGVGAIAVVVGDSAARIAAMIADAPARLVVHDRWAEGRTGSVQAGLARLPAADPIVLWPVDHPFVEAKTVRGLLDSTRGDLVTSWTIPTYHGRSGHPVVLRRAAVAVVAGLRADEPLRAVLPRLGLAVRRLPVADPGVVANVDTMEEYAAAAGAWRRREARWTDA